jgi:hypothetical protein
MRHVGKSRVELLETIDRPALKALPNATYAYPEWKALQPSALAECRKINSGWRIPSGRAIAGAKLHRDVLVAIIASGLRSSRDWTFSSTASCSQREMRRSGPVAHRAFNAQLLQALVQ